MSKTKIEWCDYTINPVKGLCPMACSYCYARAMYKRFKWNPYVRADWSAFNKIPIKPSRIFAGSTMELFGDWVKPEWMDEIFRKVNSYPQHTFLFLTKQPQNLIKFSPFPDNCWIGVSATDQEKLYWAVQELVAIEAKVKFISLEPLLEWVSPTGWLINHLYRYLKWGGIKWIIIGQQTPVKMSTMPEVGWVEEIVKAADQASIPVFLKDNLISCVDQYEFATKDGKYRQEMPIGGHDGS